MTKQPMTGQEALNKLKNVDIGDLAIGEVDEIIEAVQESSINTNVLGSFEATVPITITIATVQWVLNEFGIRPETGGWEDHSDLEWVVHCVLFNGSYAAGGAADTNEIEITKAEQTA